MAKSALALAGIACFVLPVVVFPLQGNYLTLTCALFPVLLALNWASARFALPTTLVIPMLLIANILLALPAAFIITLQSLDSRASYAHAREQVNTLHQYLCSIP
jgi:hypothetical protein